MPSHAFEVVEPVAVAVGALAGNLHQLSNRLVAGQVAEATDGQLLLVVTAIHDAEQCEVWQEKRERGRSSADDSGGAQQPPPPLRLSAGAQQGDKRPRQVGMAPLDREQEKRGSYCDNTAVRLKRQQCTLARLPREGGREKRKHVCTGCGLSAQQDWSEHVLVV